MAEVAVVISAAGASRRMGGVKKEYLPVDGRVDDEGRPLTVLAAAVTAFADCARVKIIVIVTPADGEAAARDALPLRFLQAKRPAILFTPGGKTRRSSVQNGLAALTAYRPSYVLIHDGARPWVTPSLIDAAIDAVQQYKAVIPVLPLVETPKELENGFICRHLKRANVGAAQTPQAFAFPDILLAHEKAAEREKQDGVEYTDDAEVWGEFCGPVAVVPGSPANRKITFPEDLEAL
jgi:2-C-methyl-D-erythritol 4-phosphate cytidylyltransferase